MIKIDHISFSYGEENENTGGVRDIDLNIEDGQFVVLCLSQRLFFAVALRQTHILTPATILTAVTEAGCGLTAEFRLTRESPDIHTIQGGNILTCGGKRSQL